MNRGRTDGRTNTAAATPPAPAVAGHAMVVALCHVVFPGRSHRWRCRLPHLRARSRARALCDQCKKKESKKAMMECSSFFSPGGPSRYTLTNQKTGCCCCRGTCCAIPPLLGGVPSRAPDDSLTSPREYARTPTSSDQRLRVEKSFFLIRRSG